MMDTPKWLLELFELLPQAPRITVTDDQGAVSYCGDALNSVNAQRCRILSAQFDDSIPCWFFPGNDELKIAQWEGIQAFSRRNGGCF